VNGSVSSCTACRNYREEAKAAGLCSFPRTVLLTCGGEIPELWMLNRHDLGVMVLLGMSISFIQGILLLPSLVEM